MELLIVFGYINGYIYFFRFRSVNAVRGFLPRNGVLPYPVTGPSLKTRRKSQDKGAEVCAIHKLFFPTDKIIG